MTPTNIDSKVLAQRGAWILEMIGALRDLPIKNKGEFLQNRHTVAAAESYLRRSLEALFDIGRHILVKRFAFPATEYKEIARGLLDKRILNEDEAELMRKMAGYRNRMAHFYHEITPEELHEICLNHLDEINLLLDRMLQAIKRKE